MQRRRGTDYVTGVATPPDEVHLFTQYSITALISLKPIRLPLIRFSQSCILESGDSFRFESVPLLVWDRVRFLKAIFPFGANPINGHYAPIEITKLCARVPYPIWGARQHAHSCTQRSHFPETLHHCVDSEALSGAANPGCSRLSGGLLRQRMPWFPAQETLPKGPSFASRERGMFNRFPSEAPKTG
jgi:hypothetical protein